MNINHISVSRMQCFDQCQQRYKYRYHLKVPALEDEQFYFTYGKIIHKIAEIYVEGKGEIDLKQAVRDVMDHKVPVDQKDGKDVFAAKLPPDYKKRMPQHLRAIQKLTDQIGFGGLTEYEFRHDLDPPNNRCVYGFIDRLIIKDENYFIIDYKTSKKNRWRKNISNISTDLQLRTYARVMQIKFGVPANRIRAALYYLEDGQLIGSKFSEASLQQIEHQLIDAYKQIEQTAPEDAWGRLTDQCRRCEYRKICPFYRIT